MPVCSYELHLFKKKKKYSGTGEVFQQVEAIAAKAESLTFIHMTHIEEREVIPASCLLTSTKECMYTYTNTSYTHLHNNTQK